MITLGVWGFSADRPEWKAHDTGAAIVQDGRILAAVNEERMSRIKVDNGYPQAAIDECLKIAGIGYADIDQIAMAGHIARHEFLGKARTYFRESIVLESSLRTKISMFARGVQSIKRSIRFLSPHHHHKRVAPEQLRHLKMKWVSHHKSHAATAYLCSPFSRAVILTLDGSDSAGGAGLVGLGDPKLGMIFSDSVRETNSLALLYGKITQLLGFKALRHEGKILGLAAMGNPDVLGRVYRSRIKWDDKKGWWKMPGFVLDIVRKEPPTLSNIFKNSSREDVSAALQDIVEEMVCKKVERLYADNPSWAGLPLVVAGGLFANVKLNQRILSLPCVSNIYVHPNMGDAGLAAGAALHANAEARRDWSPRFLRSVFLGTSIGPSDALKAAAVKNLNPVQVERMDVPKYVAKLLSEGNVIARAEGGMEYGPRALCNRSIIASAGDANINDWLNAQLKRSEFMPFAPVVLAEYALDYFPDYKEEHVSARFMTLTYDCSDRAVREIPAAVHVDKTARPQVLYREDNDGMHQILFEYFRITGVPALINTSFNMHEEPIVRTAEESLEAAFQANLDYIVLGGLLFKIK
jgi:carbamoyltransferase